MWHSSRGERTLTGNEAKLVREAVLTMVDELQVVPQLQPILLGTFLWDSMTAHQQLAMLDQVSLYLLKPTEVTMELTAAAEATVAAIYKYALTRIEIEVDVTRLGTPESDWREMLLNAIEERFPESNQVSQADLWNDELSFWNEMIEKLVDEVLWDRDFEMEALFLDISSDQADSMKQYMGINTDYYRVAADEVHPGEINKVIKRIRTSLK